MYIYLCSIAFPIMSIQLHTPFFVLSVCLVWGKLRAQTIVSSQPIHVYVVVGSVYEKITIEYFQTFHHLLSKEGKFNAINCRPNLPTRFISISKEKVQLFRCVLQRIVPLQWLRGDAILFCILRAFGRSRKQSASHRRCVIILSDVSDHFRMKYEF